MSFETRSWFTRPAGPMISATLGAFLLASALIIGGRIDGFPAWIYGVAGLLALVMVPSAVRRIRLGPDSLMLRGWRTRVAMDYAEIVGVEILKKRVTPFARTPVCYAALRSDDDRIGWIAAYDFSFPREAFLELGRRVQAARAGKARVNVSGQEGPSPRRSYLLAALGGALLLCGLLLLGVTAWEGLRRTQTRAGGQLGEARIAGMEGPDERGAWKIELEGPDGSSRNLTVQGGWASGRKIGERVPILLHPESASFFVLADEKAEGWSASLPALFALALLFGGGRLLARALAAPVGVLEDLEQAFRAPDTPPPSG